MQNDSLVSVLMNCYNGEKYLRDSITSLLNQSYKNWELIFWDNQSTDSSKTIFHSFKDKRLKYFYAPSHEVLYEARNQAMTKVNGDYIAFLDTDDFWKKSKLEKQISLFKNKEVGLVYSNIWKCYDFPFKFKKLHRKGKLPVGFIFNELALDYSVALTAVILRKEFLKDHPTIFNIKYNMLADYDFVLRFSKKYKFDCVQSPLAFYRIHKGNMSNRYLSEQTIQLKKWLHTNLKENFFSTENQIKIINNHLNYLELKDSIKKSGFFDSLNKIIKHSYFKEKIKLFIFLIFRKYIF
tara:strand:+ start:412 stop:1296 length:885 start_codon:yes stop_codon:yes gene_type:complete